MHVSLWLRYHASRFTSVALMPAGASTMCSCRPSLASRLSTGLPRPRPLGAIRRCYTGCNAVQATATDKATQYGAPAGNVVLMDASCFCYRFYHAAARHMSAGGASTAIEHLFLSKVLSIASRQQVGLGPASQLVVVFDSPPRKAGGQPIRRSMCPDYKANRSTPPDAVCAAMDSLPVVLTAMGINTMRLPGVEADDIIATLTTAFNKRQQGVTILSSDKDFKQLLGEQACLDRLREVETLNSFVEDHDFPPEFFPDYQALTGDASDNVAGVPGIGPKRAKKLISKFLTIENIYTAIPEMASNAVTKSLDAIDVASVLQLRTLFQLQRHVRTKEGEDLIDVLPFGPSNLIAVDRADVAWVVEYMDRLELKQDKAAFLDLVQSHAMA